MKIGPGNRTTRTMPARGATSASAAAAYSGAPAPRSIADTTSIMGIPETELTPKVKEAIFTLMEEVDKLRHSVEGLNRRLAEAEQAADQDVLLPIYNRRAFVRELTRVQATVERYNSPGSLVYIDLNGFKDINDKYGHQAGDAVLAEFSARLIHSVRETDIIGRLGGDEFGLILSRTNQESATFLTARLTRELEERPILWQGEAVQVGMAYGIVPIEPGKNAEQALSDADSKMYAHKRQDR